MESEVCIMEKKLARLFDYQKYEKNEKLQQIIDADGEYMTKLSDDDLMELAAGVGNVQGSKLGPIPRV